MAYNRGTSNQIIVGAAAFYIANNGEIAPTDDGFDDITFDRSKSLKDTLEPDYTGSRPVVYDDYRNVGYTMNGLELQFQPDFGEVQVDQVLDVAKLYKQGMQVNLATAFAEATLENLLVAIASAEAIVEDTEELTGKIQNTVNLSAGNIGECPVERGLIAVGPGTGNCDESSTTERVYIAYRALSIENVTVSAKRDAASMFEVSFRLLPNNSGSYGKIVDRSW